MERVKTLLSKWGKIADVEQFVFNENIQRLRVVAIVGAIVNIAISISNIVDQHYRTIFFQTEIYLRLLWVVLSAFYIKVSTRSFVERHNKWMKFIMPLTIIICLIMGALLSGMYFADSSYLIIYYANILLIGILIYLSLIEIILLSMPSLVVIGFLYYSEPNGILRFEGNITNIFALVFFAFVMAAMNYRLKAEQYKTLELVKSQNQELLYLSTMDVLTDMPNRRKIDEVLESTLESCTKEGKEASFMIIDIDYFKNYNDTYGHLKGDECIVQVSKTLKEFVNRYHGFIGRFGGEEFLCVLSLEENTDIQEVANCLNQTIDALGIEHKQSDKGVVTVSIGGISIKRNATSAVFPRREVLEMADRLLYQAKSQGRNRSVVQTYPIVDDFSAEVYHKIK